MLHLLLNRTTDDLYIVSDESFLAVFQTDPEYVRIEYHNQLQANGITVSRLLQAMEKYIDKGVQTALDFNFGANTKDETVKLHRVKE
jgi:hypothetical protein